MSDADPDEIRKAQRLFKGFQFRYPRGNELVQLETMKKPVVALEVGTAISIGYKAIGNGKDYYHEFEGRRPRVYVNADGNQVYFLGGIYRFTDRGFIK